MKNEQINQIFHKFFILTLFNNFFKIFKNIETNPGISGYSSRFSTSQYQDPKSNLINKSMIRESTKSKEKSQDLILPKNISFFKFNNKECFFQTISNTMKMVPIYISLIEEISQISKDSFVGNRMNNSFQSKSSHNENTKEQILGFVMSIGFSIVSNIFDIVPINQFPEEGETFQAHWEDGTTISWEAIRLADTSQGL
jgi:hypothetical protein